VALVTSAELPELAPDDRLLVEPLTRAGVDVRIAVWTGENETWSDYDRIVVRSCWDYHDDLPRWLAWLARLEREGLGDRLVNDVPTLRWNARKDYLAELEARGVPIVPTRWVPADALGSWSAVEEALGGSPWEELVCKPAVSAGAFATFRLRRSELPSAEVRLRGVLAELVRRAPLMIQPFVPEIASRGEWSLMFFEGRFSHAVLKLPAGGDFRVQQEHGGTSVAATPPGALLDLGARVLEAAEAAVRAGSGGPQEPSERFLYARVDLVEAAAGPMLIELELIEPALFLEAHPPAGPELARAIGRRAQGQMVTLQKAW
jgi:glutathione synthase/RimK-type ligase-like ATP-grasp enzyme